MKLEEFDYYLPRELIAQQPFISRDSSRLLVLHRDRDEIEHKRFYEVVEFLQEGDLLVLNNTRVIPARLKGRKKETGGKVEIFLLQKKRMSSWECLLKPAGRIREGTQIYFSQTRLMARVISKDQGAKAVVEFTPSKGVEEILAKIGQIPLPPYIKRDEGPSLEDRKRYQTVYAKEEGAVAAPTAGLHFTYSLFERIKERGIKVVEITLHTGWASFKPLSREKVEKNKIPEEYFVINKEAAAAINEVKKGKGRIVAVGTTTTRTLETQATQCGQVKPGEGWTNLFIYPGYKFKVIEGLLTNFHMPKSSLILLVAAFAGKKKLLAAYREAVKENYHFLSFGDAMLLI